MAGSEHSRSCPTQEGSNVVKTNPAAAPIFNPVPVACARLGIGRTFLYEEVAAGHIKAVKVGKRRLIPESELQRYAAVKLAEAA